MGDFKYNLAMVAIMKYEEDYVEEWVKYHYLLGVKHFYIYDNNEDSYMRTVLKPYIEKEIVTLIPAYGENKMFESYNDAIKSYKNECKYIAFIDADEFIVPIQDVPIDTCIEEIFDKVKDNPHIGALGIRWQIYGTSNHKTKPEGYVIQNYLYTTDTGFNNHIKSIVNPRRVLQFSSPHYCKFIDPEDYIIDQDGNRIVKDWNYMYCNIDKIRINHYYYKSEEEFTKLRVQRGKCDRVISQDAIQGLINAQLTRMQNSNHHYDDLMLRYIERLDKFTI